MEKNKLPYPKSNFKVPEGYFETLEDRIMASVISSENKEKAINKNETGFKVPAHYFGNFEERLFERIKKEKKPSKLVQFFNTESYYYIAAAAAVFVALFTTPLSTPPQPLSIENIEMAALEDYLDETSEYSDFSQIIQPGEFNLISENESEIKEEAIIEYLNENLEETALIYNGN